MQNRFRDDGDTATYKDFLNILQRYYAGRDTLHELLAAMTALFRHHPDLLLGFQHFLPESFKVSEVRFLYRPLCSDSCQLSLVKVQAGAISKAGEDTNDGDLDNSGGNMDTTVNSEGDNDDSEVKQLEASHYPEAYSPAPDIESTNSSTNVEDLTLAEQVSVGSDQQPVPTESKRAPLRSVERISPGDATTTSADEGRAGAGSTSLLRSMCKIM
jgi:hypothetical protein